MPHVAVDGYLQRRTAASTAAESAAAAAMAAGNGINISQDRQRWNLHAAADATANVISYDGDAIARRGYHRSTVQSTLDR